MTNAAPEVASALATEAHAFGLPTVGVIIVNYNYGAYLEAAVASVFSQTYERVECILLDNGSTDDSADVIARLAARFPAMKVVMRADNAGQSAASLEGFLATSAPYVTFLDADDMMLPDFLSTHMFTHLSLRMPLGFTCSDMFQTLGDDLVLGTFVALNAFVRSGAGRQADLMRPVDCSETALPLSQLRPVPSDAVHYAGPELRDWPWASMSAFVFRRDALNLVIHNPALKTLTSSFDVYLARGVNVLTGSAVIDRALSVYRMHSSNVFARHPQLAGVFNFERHGGTDHEGRARRMLIDHLFATADVLLQKLQNQGDFLRAVRVLNDIGPRLMSLDNPRRTYLQDKFIEALPRLRPLVPRSQVMLWALRLRLWPFAV